MEQKTLRLSQIAGLGKDLNTPGKGRTYTGNHCGFEVAHGAAHGAQNRQRRLGPSPPSCVSNPNGNNRKPKHTFFRAEADGLRAAIVTLLGRVFLPVW
jgi:hypothetical protein